MTRRSRSSAARLHHAVREIVFASNPEEGLLEALKLANDPPEEWEQSMWLTVAVGVESAAHREANWWRVAILAYEQLTSDAISRDALTAMQKRVNLIEKVGPRAHDRFADPEVVFAWFRAVVRETTAEQALEGFRRAYEMLFASDPSSDEGAAARDGVMRGRRLRDGARLLQRLRRLGVPIQDDLAPWLRWATVHEQEGQVIENPEDTAAQ